MFLEKGRRVILIHLNCSNYCISKWGEGDLEIAIVPFSTSGLTIPEGVHSVALLPAFMPRPFVEMAVGKVIHPKAMDFISKVLPGVSISIPITHQEPNQDAKSLPHR